MIQDSENRSGSLSKGQDNKEWSEGLDGLNGRGADSLTYVSEQQFQEEHRPKTTVAAIMLAVLFMGLGSALQGTALAIRAGLEGFPESVIGLIMSMFYIGLAIGIFIAGPVIRTVGYVRSFAAFASIASATAILHVIIVNPVVWIFLQLSQTADGSSVCIVWCIWPRWGWGNR